VLTLAVENAQSLDVLGPVEAFDSANSLTLAGRLQRRGRHPRRRWPGLVQHRLVLEAKPLPDRLRDTTRVEHGRHAARWGFAWLGAR
jgi:hypothetical protein